METTAIVKGARLSPQKGRLVADLVRGKPVDKALNILSFTQKKAAGLIKKALESAIANAEHNDGADIDELRVTRIYVEKGPVAAALRRARQGPRHADREEDLSHLRDGRRRQTEEIGQPWVKRSIPPASACLSRGTGRRAGSPPVRRFPGCWART